MPDHLSAVEIAPIVQLFTAKRPMDLYQALSARRSIRSLQDGPFTYEIQSRLHEAISLTPSAYNQPPWHVVIVRDRRDEFWEEVEAGFIDALSGDRLERFLQRLSGFRTGAAIAVIYEDRSALQEMQAAWGISSGQAQAFSEQGLGMVQLAIWLALTTEGLVASLQHWEWLLEARLSAFLGLPDERFRLTAIMPIGYPAEPPRSVERIAVDRVVSKDRYVPPRFSTNGNAVDE